MTTEDLVKSLDLESRHYTVEYVKIPIIDGHLYTTLGRQLFDIYQRLKISSEDQREIERLSFALQSFTFKRMQPTPLWQRLRTWISKRRRMPKGTVAKLCLMGLVQP